jgi:DNA-binding GntR family transcriptional regulator
LVAQKAAVCQDETLRRALKDTMARMATAAEAEDSDAWLEADIELHDLLFKMADNDRAQRIVANLNDQWHRLRIGFVAIQGRISRSTAEHQRVAACVLDGDGEGAEREIRAHLNQVRDELVRLLVNVVLPFAESGV